MKFHFTIWKTHVDEITLEVNMSEENIYTKALTKCKKKENENDKIVLLIQGTILGFALFWEIRKLLKQDKKAKKQK